VFLLGALVYAPTGLFTPALQAQMTRIVGPGEQGRLQGANGGIMGLTGLVGPLLFTQSLAWGLRSGHPGAPFYVGAGLLLGAAGLSVPAAARAAARASAAREEHSA
jgi:DHA1 family tetracycline resistance protein-like MFS transporter